MYRASAALAIALLAAPSMAFLPSPAPHMTPRDVSMSATQGEQAWGAMKKLSFLPLALVGMTGTGMVSPEPAFADGSVSAGTVQRAGALYGPRMIALKSAAEKGDFDAFIQEENAARLFNSGAFALNKPLRKEVEAKYAEVAKAVKAKDAAALKTSFAAYFKAAGLDNTNPFKKDDVGQAYSGDFDFRRRNKNFDANFE